MNTLGIVVILAAGLTGAGVVAQGQRTSRDRIYSKAQAERGAATWVTRCESCHDPAKLPSGKKGGPVLIGDPFLAEWENRPLGELLTITQLTMPNDGTASLSEDETADVIAYMLQANGFPAGPADLTFAAGQDIVIVKK